MKKVILSLIVLMILITPVYAIGENQVNVYFFYGQGCPHCSHEKTFLGEMEEKYDYLNVEKYEIYNDDDNRELFQQCSAIAGVSIQGVPTTFIDAKPHIGFSNDIGSQIESEIIRCSQELCTNMLKSETENATCDTDIQDYEKESAIGNILMIVLGVIIIYFIINKVFFKKKSKKKGKKK